MNFSFYTFKQSNNNYDQYPLDNNSELFKEFIHNHKGDVSLTIYRSLRLTYYTYIQEGENKDDFFGIALVFNSVYCKNTKSLFELFEKTIINEAKNSKLFYCAENGKITLSDEKLYLLQGEIEKLREIFKEKIDAIGNEFIATDSSFELGNDAIKELPLFDGNDMINAAVRKYQQVLVTRDFIAEEKRRKRKQRIKYSSIIIALLLAIIIGGIIHLQIDKKRDFNESKVRLKEHIVNKNIGAANSLYKRYIDLYPKDNELRKLKEQIEFLEKEKLDEDVKRIFDDAKDVAKFAAEKKDPSYYQYAIERCDSALKLQSDNTTIINFRDSIKKIDDNIKNVKK